MAGIYIHIPFCHKACHYCGFHFTTNLSGIDDMTSALIKEIQGYRTIFKHPIQSIYFGGGTPSILTTTAISRILETIYQNYEVVDAPEITLEANPEDLQQDYTVKLIKTGVNRLSIGIQTYDDRLLSFINRNHTSEQAARALINSREAGFRNINLDLIYSLPNSSTEILENDLSKILEEDPEHISIYAFTVEAKTAFENWIRKGKIKEIHEEIEANQFELIMATLDKAGYEQYEISNFSKPGYNSKHNTSYWTLSPYLGIGPSAHSFDDGKRWANSLTNFQYIRDIGQGKSIAVIESRNPHDILNEYIFTSLRTHWGCNLTHFKRRWNFDFENHFSAKIDFLIHQGMVEKVEDSIILTKNGKLLADHIASELFVGEEDFAG